MRDLNVWVSVLKGWSCCSVSVLCPTLWGPMDSSLPDFSVWAFPGKDTGVSCHGLLLEFQIHVHWAGDAIQSSHLLLPPFPPALSLSKHQGLFQSVSTLHPVAKNWNFSFSISRWSPLGLNWFDLHAVQRTLGSLLQHYNSKASVFWCSAFFMAQVSHLYYRQGWRHECKVQSSEMFQVGTKDRGLHDQAKEVTIQKNALK